ncbi:MAG TPA: ThiF family adenylyltransferase [Longimicrobiales bacterium]
MSPPLINRSADLRRLRDEGYDVDVVGGYLVVRQVPYVNGSRKVKFGILVSELTLAGEVTARPSTHVIHFAGEYPCHQDGSPIEQIRHRTGQMRLDENLVVDHSFSSKPPSGGYSDYYEKVTTYVAILSSPAHALDPSVTPCVFPVIEAAAEESVFHYTDTASSRARINTVTKKLEGGSVGIIGLGGTGAYVLDLIAKTPVAEIHLFDGDRFLQHNAFRSPGAPSLEDLRQEPKKVAYYAERYGRMRRNIIAHDCYITADNAALLEGLDFAFVCVDDAAAKGLIIESLEAYGVSFIDVGMGIQQVDGSLRGLLRVTTSTPEKRDHVGYRVSRATSVDDAYTTNIQIAELNALNAALAVIRWKKLRGFYADLEHEYNSTYTLDGNVLTNDDRL